jgi:rhodanese-related sulfurtransferase
MEIETIERDELKAKLDGGADIRLVMSLQRWAFEALHIPGSLHFDTPEELLSALGQDDEIIVYCSDPACVGSRFAYKKLVRQRVHKCKQVRRRLERLAGSRVSVGGNRRRLRGPRCPLPSIWGMTPSDLRIGSRYSTNAP